MTISELIKELEAYKKECGDIEVRMYDQYEANEGWGEYDVWCDEIDVFFCENERMVDGSVKTFIGLQ